jgi:pimeloyl-ACP methyl ester carboxylesterase
VRRRLWAAAFVGCALVLSACATPVQPGAIEPAAAAGAIELAAAPAAAAGAFSWHACGANLQCAKVPVPLDWDHPHRKKIKLAVVRHLASNPAQRIGSIFVNPGGPGESGVEIVTDNGDQLDDWGGGRFDIVGWDPRGTNASSPLKCFTSSKREAKFWHGMQIPTTKRASAKYATKMTQLSRRCAKVSGKLVTHISTADTARDLNALRKGVGDRMLTYIGLSYGTMLGRTYANMYPKHVRAMMLDSLADQREHVRSAEARTAGGSAGVDAVFAQFLALCQGAGPDRCALARHAQTVEQRVHRLFKQVRRAPIPAPYASPPGRLSYGDLLLTTFTPMRDPNSWPAYARALNAAARGDASVLETSAREMRTPYAFNKATTSAAIQCADAGANKPVSDWPTVMRRLTNAGALWGPVLGWWQWAPCAANWPRTTDAYVGPWNAKTPNPLLLINNVYDPATRYFGAKRAQKELGNAVLLTVAGYGHPSYQLPSKCVDDYRVSYLVDLQLPARGTVCADDDTPFSDTEH